MQFNTEQLSDEALRAIYSALLYPRLIEEKMLLLLRQGRITKWFSGIGQEAISVGGTTAMQTDEWILPMHRNLGVFTTRDMPLDKLFLQWEGRQEGYSKGRERSFHFGNREHHICGMISHLGPQLSIADGIALAHKLKKEQKATLVFTGEGGTSEGEFHEALNVAAVWDLPVIFLIENNGYGLSTPASEQYRCARLSDRAAGYGMEGMTIDGNNVLEVYHTVQKARKRAVAEQKPFLIECMTFRMRGHEEASGTKYIPPELFEQWGEKDPLRNFEAFLVNELVLSAGEIAETRRALKEKIDHALKPGLSGAAFRPDTKAELQDVYRRSDHSASSEQPPGPVSDTRFIGAVSAALRQAMEKHENLILMGQDIAEYGGAFKITEGFMEQFGKQRVRNTPLCESAIIGAALGLSLEGYKSVVEMQFADFVTCGFNQIINNLAKIHYRWGQNAEVVIRMPTGAGVNAGPFHSQSNEAWFVHTPGLKVVYPSNPYDAKGLLLAAIEDPNPVMYFEHKALYRSLAAKIPDVYYTVEIGKARRVLTGDEVSIITYGMAVGWALHYAETHRGVSIDLLDLRTLSPLDYNSIYQTVKKTGKVLVLHEDTLTGGIGGEIAAWISEHAFQWLDAPVMRCASLDTPVPFAKALEQNFLAENRLEEIMEQLLRY
ncbi:MAG TPA: dehydrogenase E1 component subunit alpha/beta [Chitinophagaceae bacterium]|nr:dehydrogenase E1 component subunit alpha/beta [Chitinophagaceae bacterium]